jgi:hypothetical protein
MRPWRLGAPPPWPARATDNEGACREHNAEEGKWADPFWGLTVPSVAGNGGSSRLRWRKHEEAPCGAGELTLATTPSSHDLYTGEVDE